MSLKPEHPALHPTIFVIFGITGDLANRKLLPALLALFSKKLLPPRFSIIGFSRRNFSREEFREFIRGKMNIRPGQFKEEDIKHFLDNVSYEQGVFDDPLAYERLAERLKGIDDRWGQCSNKLIHLSVPPHLYENILNHVSNSGLNVPCADDTGWTRILIEKPFGSDISGAQSLDKLLGKLFDEEQIFRIDHYLAKESLQNIIAFRFSNSIFEPIWNHEFVEQVHIRLFEKNGVEGRGAFYDSIGALRDVGQNHLLQMLALVAMDRPKSLTAKGIRRERSNTLKSINLLGGKISTKNVNRAQYIGYEKENGVSKDTQTETYFRVTAEVRNARWKKVPFHIESGKCMSESKTEISFYFKSKFSQDQRNILTFRIQPEEGIKIKFFVKIPGYEWKIDPKTLKFAYSDLQSFQDKPNDYERLIHDAFVGDQTLFASTEEIMASWKFITPILEGFKKIPLIRYDKGVKEI